MGVQRCLVSLVVLIVDLQDLTKQLLAFHDDRIFQQSFLVFCVHVSALYS